jgi:hypothetical protein
VAHSRRAARVSPVHHTSCPQITAKRIVQKVPLVLSGGRVGRNNPKGRRLPPSLDTLVHPTATHSPPLGIPWPLAARTTLASYPAIPIAPVPVPVATYRASGSPQVLTGSTLNHRHDTANVNGTHVGTRVKCAGTEVWSTGDTCGALTPYGTRVTGAPRIMPKNYGKKDSQKVSLVRRGECVGRNNPKGRRLRPCAHTIVHLMASHSPSLGIPRRCPSLHPRSHTCQGCTPSPSPSPRTALRARRRRLPALYSPTVTTPPM